MENEKLQNLMNIKDVVASSAETLDSVKNLKNDLEKVLKKIEEKELRLSEKAAELSASVKTEDRGEAVAAEVKQENTVSEKESGKTEPEITSPAEETVKVQVKTEPDIIPAETEVPEPAAPAKPEKAETETKDAAADTPSHTSERAADTAPEAAAEIPSVETSPSRQKETTFVPDRNFNRPARNFQDAGKESSQRPAYKPGDNNQRPYGQRDAQRPPYQPANGSPRYGERKPYDPNAPRRPYDPNFQRKPYDPNAPRRPYDPNAPKRPFGDRPQGLQRPAGARPPQKPGNITFVADVKPQKKDFSPVKKKTPEKNYESNSKAMNKRALIRKGFVAVDNTDVDEKMGSKKFKVKKAKTASVVIAPKVDKAVITTETITVKSLSEKIGRTTAEILQKMVLLGYMVNINSPIDFDTAQLVAMDLGVELEQKLEKTGEEVLMDIDNGEDDEKDLVTRPPVVTVMGHVDHGKTSILDYFRKTRVTEGEAGGITQHIGAYTIKLKGKQITFIDTPGHAAFTAMRARGAKITDIVILVVAADDGVMPQTIEAINHAKSANVPIIVAVNKIDKTGADIERIKQQLTEHGIVPEEWGGDAIIAPCSAKTGEGMLDMLDMILLVAEMRDLKANPNRLAKGAIIEAKLDKGKGPVATVLVQNGTLRVGDVVLSGTATGKIRAMTDDTGRPVKSAGPSMPVSVIGFTDVPQAGDTVYVTSEEKLSKQVAEERRNREKAEKNKISEKITLDDMYSKIEQGAVKELRLIVKADVQGSAEAVKASLEKIKNEECCVKVVHSGVGAISESDIDLATVTNAVIIGFNVRPSSNAKAAAEREGIDIRLYNIIYNAIDDVESALKGMLSVKYKETVLGHAEVRNIFKISNVGTIAGSYVTDGKISRQAKIKVYRDNVFVYDGKIASLKHLKDDVKDISAGFECGIGIENFNDIKNGDVLEAYIMETVQQ